MKPRLLPPNYTRRVRSIVCRGAATALIACTCPVVAEPEAAEAGRAATSLPQWMLRAQQRLALEPAQLRELRILISQSAERMRELGASGSRDVHREGMATLRREFRDALVDILSPGQLAEWDALLEELLGEVHLRQAPRLANAH